MARLAFASVLLLLSFAALAAGSRLPDNPAAVVSEQSALRAALESTPERYKHLDAARRQQVLERQARLTAQLAAVSRWEDLPEADRELVAAERAWILAAVQPQDEGRAICTNERVLGSQRIQRVCRSPEQVERARREARDAMTKGTRCGNATCVGQ
ncbi:MAG TPA: hypothetical protein VEY50_03830 [Lysobacter sp.]|nr:hypothetical protein [Lysobacter sp.]